MAIIFSKSLTEKDVIASLSIPTSSMGLTNLEDGYLLDMHACDGSGRPWSFRCSIQHNENEGSVLCVEWLEFIRDRDIKVKDKVIFTEEKIMENQTVGARMKVEIKRKIRLFGQDIWADVK